MDVRATALPTHSRSVPLALAQNTRIDPRVARYVFSDFVKTQPSRTKWADLKRKAGVEVRFDTRLVAM